LIVECLGTGSGFIGRSGVSETSRGDSLLPEAIVPGGGDRARRLLNGENRLPVMEFQVIDPGHLYLEVGDEECHAVVLNAGQRTKMRDQGFQAIQNLSSVCIFALLKIRVEKKLVGMQLMPYPSQVVLFGILRCAH
jgi:hypothetical protein